MTNQFDDLARAMAGSHSRRSVLKMVGVAAFGATAATMLKPFRGQAAGCAVACGAGCCGQSEICSDPSSGCCCPSGTTPCGTTCCAAGIACADSRAGVCGCPAGKTQCGRGSGLTCCGSGKPCGDASCQPVANFSSNVAKTCSPPCSTGTVLFTDDFNDVVAADCKMGTDIPNWTIAPGGNVDVFAAAGASGNVVDLDGSPNECGGNGTPLFSKTTPIAVVQGRTYTACFRIGTNPSPFAPGGITADVNKATVTFGPVSHTYTKQPSSQGNYTTESLSFVASATGTAALTFQEVGPSDRGGITVDTVTVTEQT